jgi:hypothetical protein
MASANLKLRYERSKWPAQHKVKRRKGHVFFGNEADQERRYII